MMSIRPLISNCFSKPLGTVLSMLITIGITVKPHVPQFLFRSLTSSKFLSIFSLSVIFALWSTVTEKSTRRQILSFFFMLINTKSVLLTWVWWSVFYLKLLLFNFQFYFWYLIILHRVFTQDLAWEKVVIICILFIYVFCCLFCVIFFALIELF